MRALLGFVVCIGYTFLSTWVINYLITGNWIGDVPPDAPWIGMLAAFFGILNTSVTALAAVLLAASWEDGS